MTEPRPYPKPEYGTVSALPVTIGVQCAARHVGALIDAPTREQAEALAKGWRCAACGASSVPPPPPREIQMTTVAVPTATPPWRYGSNQSCPLPPDRRRTK